MTLHKRAAFFLGALLLTQSTCNDQAMEAELSNQPASAANPVLAAKSTGDPKKDYAEFCANCHGANLKEFIGRDWIYGKSWNQIFQSISTGYPDDGMPGYAESFSKDELTDLTDYILESMEDKRQAELYAPSEGPAIVESRDMRFRREVIAEDLRVPWGIAFLPDGDLLVTERRGNLWRIKPDGARVEIKNLPKVAIGGQGGLLDVEIDPDYETNHYIYLSFSKPVGAKATTAVVQAKLNGNTLAERTEIFAADPPLPTRHHYGSRLAFDAAGYLYITVGDRGRRDDNPQTTANDCGKVHRIYTNGQAVETNHFYGMKGRVPTIFTLGHRNPQGMAVHPETGEIWVHEHGPRGGDEINRLESGENYGWPVISYGINYNGTIFTEKTEEPGMRQPEHYWVPSIAPCGMDFVTGEQWGAWQGDLLVGSLVFRYVSRVIVEDGKVTGEEDLLKDIGRVREIEMGPDGLIYIVAEEPGRILRLSPEP